ncbi:Elongator subunit Iki1 family protein [Candida albicans]|uniref:Elongator complex protein 5 n=1 Tax=Candida albicans TaxID=5476 RepID=A0A8H6BXX7_CANAX|nr:Elongator subunit Iki1 family protein [Candida albicans]
MSSTSQNATVLLTRLLSLKENSSFHLILDSLTQSSYYLIQEYIHRFGPFVAQLVGPEITLVGVYHTQCPVAASKYPNYPSSETLLSYIASTIFELYPLIPDSLDEEELDAKVKKLTFPINSNLNSAIFKVILTNRRKSGRSLTYTLIINSLNHEYEIWKDKQESDEILQEDESLLKDLTTFNLTTSSKQKLAREQVELPFMQAQESLGAAGGAIVYEFEKDDDYDEEDPYEDPF